LHNWWHDDVNDSNDGNDDKGDNQVAHTGADTGWCYVSAAQRRPFDLAVRRDPGLVE
jgi:hypothetical protein